MVLYPIASPLQTLTHLHGGPGEIQQLEDPQCLTQFRTGRISISAVDFGDRNRRKKIGHIVLPD